MFKTWIGLLLFATLSIFSCSDDPVSPVMTGSIEGQVIDATTAAPIALASITTNPGTVAITSDSSGHYTISHIEPGTYAVRASKTGYNSTSISVAVSAEKVTEVVIVLEEVLSENSAPLPPSNPKPVNGAINQSLRVDLTWSGSDLNLKDSLTYDLYLGGFNFAMTLIAANLSDTTFKIDELKFDTMYYWQVVAKDPSEAVAYSPVWNFFTVPFPENRIVFASNRDGNYAIYSASADDGAAIKLFGDSNRNWWPRMSPNRNRIAFAADATDNPQIYVMTLQGAHPQKITRNSVTANHCYGTGFCWSPDGTQLVYPHFEKLYRIHADGSNLTQLATAPEGKQFRECDWSPLGDKLVVLTGTSSFYDTEIYLMDSDGSNMSRIWQNTPGALLSPSFSPDGKTIAFTQDVSGHEISTGRQLDAHIFILHIDGSDTVDVSAKKSPGTNDLYPRWSPDGAKIIFCNGSNDDATPKDIWVMLADGTERQKLIENGMMPDWR